MRNLKRIAGLIFTAVAIVSAAHAQSQGFYLKDGDCLLFYGDSITQQRFYTNFVETYVLTRWPEMKVTFINSGWGGDRVTGGGGGTADVRLQRDVIAYHPSVVTVMLGMNDGRVQAFNQDIFNTFSSGYQHIVQTLREKLPEARLTLIQPSPYDDMTRPPRFEGGYNAVLVRYGQFIKDLAQQQNLGVADLNAPVVAALQKARTIDDSLSQKLIPDRIHPGPGIHLVMAEALLRAWNAPATVTAVEIDARKGKATRAGNTLLTGLIQKRDTLSWTQLDRALPMPVDTRDSLVALAVRASDAVEALNQETLKVAGLKKPRYALKIDGEEVGSWTKENLAAGINLGALSTPMAKQAMGVHDLTLKHNDIHFTRWRQVQIRLPEESTPAFQKALEALDALEADLVRQQHAAAQPKAHQYELLPKP